ncbi:SdpI family protein [Sphingomonas bacterium]|uniref:SdpI family protein n=1 Tax=Sphingomonas bacterium TaxID=1895847 RepID=UPI00157651CB|nr:SdpI family protein [Sphingomonas bacterium]
MSERRMIGSTMATACLLAGVATRARSRLPPSARLPTHWNIAGEPDGFLPAAPALFLPIALAMAVSAVFVIVARLEPLQQRMERSRALLDTAWGALLGLTAVIEVAVAAPAFGWHLPATLPLVAAGAVLAVIGNALPKSRPGFFVGLRTPWSIIDADNWVATHRLGAWTFIAAGVTIALAGLLPIEPGMRQALVIGGLVVALVPPVVWSWWLWRSRSSPARGGGPLD